MLDAISSILPSFLGPEKFIILGFGSSIPIAICLLLSFRDGAIAHLPENQRHRALKMRERQRLVITFVLISAIVATAGFGYNQAQSAADKIAEQKADRAVDVANRTAAALDKLVDLLTKRQIGSVDDGFFSEENYPQNNAIDNNIRSFRPSKAGRPIKMQ